MSFNETTQDVLGIVARFCGLFLLFIGLWIAVQVFTEAIELYRNPDNIEKLATLIEKGSNIDRSIAPVTDTILEGIDAEADKPADENSADDFRLSYFAAWVIQLLLLILLARISIMAIKTGGELVLYDTQAKQLARYIIKASKK